MGWLWSSVPAQEKTQLSSQTKPEPPPASSTSSSTTPVDRGETLDRELHSFLQEIEADTLPSSTKYNRISRQPPPTDPSDPSNEPLADQLLPKTMSCRDAFDAAFYCNSLGGQFNNLYRYGNVRSCSESWNDFWFCMRTRSYGTTEKEKAIQARYREKERVRYGRDMRVEEQTEEVGRSSEDVWKSRERKVEWGEAFNQPFPPLPGTENNLK